MPHSTATNSGAVTRSHPEVNSHTNNRRHASFLLHAIIHRGVSLFRMSILSSFVFVACASAQSLFSSSFTSDDPRTNTCLRRTVAVHTQGSATYVVSNLGSTSFPVTPTLCANVSISTVYGPNQTVTKALPPSTITVYQQPTTPGPIVITDSGFENGQSSPFNSSASGPQVSAQVAQAGTGQPLQHYSGHSFLCVTSDEHSTMR